MATTTKRVGIIGSGLVGRSFAILFASAGYKVTMYDVDERQVTEAVDNILVQLNNLDKQGLLRGGLSVQEQYALIQGTKDLAECLCGAFYVQECVPERLEIKKAVFAKIDDLIGDDNEVILASSTSSMPCSTFSSEMKHRSQVIVVHPINPPTIIPLVELVPSPWTRPELVQKTRTLVEEIGQKPVVLKKEVPGFAVNRLQYALIAECLRLVKDGAISVEDIDTVMSDGLGMRYAFIGALETCHLNAEGIKNYGERYGEGIFSICDNFGPAPKMEGDLLEKLGDAMENKIPLNKLEERRAWRDKRVAALSKLKKNMDSI